MALFLLKNNLRLWFLILLKNNPRWWFLILFKKDPGVGVFLVLCQSTSKGLCSMERTSGSK